LLKIFQILFKFENWFFKFKILIVKKIINFENVVQMTSLFDDEQYVQHAVPTFQFMLSDGAVMPAKNPDDVGFDLTIIRHTRDVKVPCYNVGTDKQSCTESFVYCKEYTTGVRVKPPPGYYGEIIGRSSISTTGYTVANCVGVIDPGYRGELLIRLVPDCNAPPLTLPCRIAQYVPRAFIKCQAEQVDKLDDTERGEGGFGSTGKI